jgi:hypothetical protein
MKNKILFLMLSVCLFFAPVRAASLEVKSVSDAEAAILQLTQFLEKKKAEEAKKLVEVKKQPQEVKVPVQEKRETSSENEKESRELSTVLAETIVELKKFVADHKPSTALNLIGAGIGSAVWLNNTPRDDFDGKKAVMLGAIVAGSAAWWSLVLMKDAAVDLFLGMKKKQLI